MNATTGGQGHQQAWPAHPGYEQLAAVLRAAHDQAAIGKGADRHANGLPFHEQPMQTGSDILGTDAGLAFQVIKKVREGRQFAELDRLERELLGAINYLAGMVIWHRRQHAKAAGADILNPGRPAGADPV